VARATPMQAALAARGIFVTVDAFPLLRRIAGAGSRTALRPVEQKPPCPQPPYSRMPCAPSRTE